MRTLIAAAAALALTVPATADTKYTLTGENTKVKFVGTKTDGKHEGGFKTLTGTASLTTLGDLTTLKLKVEIDMDSTWSDNEKLTGHLKAPDFFSVKDYPKAKFVSTKVTKTDDGVTITGDLTLRGKTASISIPAKVIAGRSFKLDSSFTIDKTQFGMTYGAGKIDDKVALTVAVEVN